MFGNTNLGVLNFGFPDVCLVPAGPIPPIPTPFPNLSVSTTHIPTVFNIFFGGGPVQNLLGIGPLTLGDTGGILLGLISHFVDGPSRPFTCSLKTFSDGIPSTRMTTVNGVNGMIPNTVAISCTPAQVRVILLS